MPLNWSPKQAQAINILGTNVLVSASAGAGKTTVLIGRLMKRMEEDRVQLDEIIAMTFTDLAAMEMRKRLLKELNQRIDQLGEDQVDTKDFLKKQVVLLPSAQISTIHSFCLALVQKYSYVLKIDPAITQNILDEAQKSYLMDEAFETVIADFAKNQKDKLNTLLQYFDSRPESKSTLKENVFNMLRKINTLIDEDLWIERSLNAMDTSDFESMSAELKALIHLYYVWKIEDMIAKAEMILRQIPLETAYIEKIKEKPANEANFNKALSEIFAVKEALSQILDKLNDFNYSQFRQSVIDLHLVGLTPLPITNQFKEVNAYAGSLKAAYGKLLAELYEEPSWFNDLSVLKPIMLTFAQLTKAFRDQYNALKIAEKVMDFDDMEHYALRILKDDEFKVRSEFVNRYKEIMVDEFQDTNYVQNEIVELISNGSNIFRVGDVKQSIYRFRNAEPGLMMNLMTHPNEGNKTLYLSENYRSKFSIVDFNNDLFDKLMNFEQLPSRYTNEDKVEIGNKERQKDGPVVELHLLDLELEADNEPDDTEDEETVQMDNQNEFAPDDLEAPEVEIDPFKEDANTADPKAKHIVNQILYLKEHSDHRKYSDYVVLVRTNEIKMRMKKVLENARIPHQVSVKTGFFNSDAVQDVLLLINHMINPHDNINFIGLCLSDFMGLNETECAKIRLAVFGYESIYTAFQRLYPNHYGALRDLETSIRSSNLLDALRSIFMFNEYYDKYCSKQQRANLDLLFDKAQLFSEKNLSLSEFLLLLKRIDDEDSSEAIPFTEEDDVVRVMTIHQSKGLEFKVVFYWSQGKISVKDNSKALLLDSKLGFIINTLRLPKRFKMKNPIRKALEMKSSLDDVLEQVRVLYVALTRAEDKLILVDVQPKMTYPLHYTNILNSLGPTNWVLMANQSESQLLVRHFPSPSEPLPLDQQTQTSQDLVIYPKEKSSIEFKTPSSKHTKFTHFKLNFNQNIGANHGTLIHDLFDKLPKVGVNEMMIKELHPEISYEDLDAIMTFYDHEIYKHCAEGDIHHEFPFYALMGSEVIHGYMDMVSFTKEDTILIDFKTDRVDHEATLRELYTDQLNDYVRVLKQIHPEKPVKAYLYSLALKSFVEVL